MGFYCSSFPFLCKLRSFYPLNRSSVLSSPSFLANVCERKQSSTLCHTLWVLIMNFLNNPTVLLYFLLSENLQIINWLLHHLIVVPVIQIHYVSRHEFSFSWNLFTFVILFEYRFPEIIQRYWKKEIEAKVEKKRTPSSNLYYIVLPIYTTLWKSLSPVWLFANPWTIQFMEFSKPEYWSG